MHLIPLLSQLSGMSSTSWLMNSTCYNHITPHSSLFSDLKPAPHPLNIRTANSSTIFGHNIGLVSTSNPSVPGVFNVSDLSYNLFFVGQLAELGYRITFDYSGCIVQDPRTGQELGIDHRVGRMFPVDNLRLPLIALVSVAAAAAVSSTPSLALWHARLGQASSSQVQQLAFRGLLSSVSTENFDYVSCQLGKQLALPFNTSESISTNIFDLIHSDVWRPSSVSSIGTSQQNGRAEQKLHHILDTVRALLLFAKVPAPFWGEAALHAIHTINRIPSPVIQNQTPYKRLFRSPLDYHHLRSFGSACFVLLQPYEHNKLEPWLRLCCFLGYGKTQKRYRCYDPVSHRLRTFRNVVFWEHRLFVELSHFNATLSSSSVLDLFPNEIEDEQVEDELPNPNPEPRSLAPASLEDLTQDIPLRHSTWIKTRSDGSIERYKAHLVAKGFTQEYGIDYEETFTSITCISSVCALLAVAAASK
nr:retrovirus-related pol polyprotein from transposon tnt 1-94 [Quercus suber]